MTVHHLPKDKPRRIRLIGLARVSTEEQATEGKSGLDRQVEAIKGIVQAEVDSVLVDTIILKGVSGSDVPETLEWQNAILPFVQNPDCHLAVAAVDRLLRPDNFNFQVLEDLQRTGTMLYTPAGKQDPHSVAGYLVLGLGGVIGGLEKLQIKERVHLSKELKRRRGEHPQSEISLPTGVSYDRDNSRWHYTPDVDKVRRAFNLVVVEGETCLADICRHTGIKSIAALRSILRNPIYRGERVIDTKRGTQVYKARKPGKQADRRKVPRADEEIIRVRVFGGEGQEPQLVSDEAWHQAQKLLAESREHFVVARRNTLIEAPYSGVLFSSYGGPEYRLHVVVGRRGRRGTAYVCRCIRWMEEMKEDRCELRYLPTGPITAALDAFLVQLTTDTWFVETVLIPQHHEQSARIGSSLDEVRALLSATEGKLKRLQDAYVEGNVEEDYYHRKLRQLRETRDLQQAEEERLAARASQKDDGGQKTRLKKYWEEGVGRFDPSWPHEFKLGFIHQHFAEIIISNDGVELFKVRIPQGPDGIPEEVGVVPPETTWKDLLGYDPFDKTERLAARGTYTSAKIAERLGLKGSQAVNYLLKTGVLPQPAQVMGGGRHWNEEEAKEAEAAYKAHTAEPEPYKWDLPKKERYYRSDVAKVLGVNGERVRYMVDRAMIPEPAGRDNRGARFWTEEEVERLVAATSDQSDR